MAWHPALAHGNIGTRLPYLSRFLTIPPPSENVVPGRQIGRNDDRVHNHAASPVTGAVSLLCAVIRWVSRIWASGLAGAVRRARRPERHASSALVVSPVAIEATRRHFAHPWNGITSPRRVHWPRPLIHKDALEGKARSVVPYKRLFRTVKIQRGLLEALFSQRGVRRTQAILVSTSMIVPHAPANFDGSPGRPHGTRRSSRKNL